MINLCSKLLKYGISMTIEPVEMMYISGIGPISPYGNNDLKVTFRKSEFNSCTIAYRICELARDDTRDFLNKISAELDQYIIENFNVAYD